MGCTQLNLKIFTAPYKIQSKISLIFAKRFAFYGLRLKKQTWFYVLLEFLPIFSTVHKWSAQFKRGETNTKDALRSGRPNTATSADNVKKVREIVLTWPTFEVKRDTYQKNVHILHEVLCMTSPVTWLLRLLTPAQKTKPCNFIQASSLTNTLLYGLLKTVNYFGRGLHPRNSAAINAMYNKRQINFKENKFR